LRFFTTEVATFNGEKNGQNNNEYNKRGTNKMTETLCNKDWQHIAPNETLENFWNEYANKI